MGASTTRKNATRNHSAAMRTSVARSSRISGNGRPSRDSTVGRCSPTQRESGSAARSRKANQAESGGRMHATARLTTPYSLMGSVSAYRANDTVKHATTSNSMRASLQRIRRMPQMAVNSAMAMPSSRPATANRTQYVSMTA